MDELTAIRQLLDEQPPAPHLVTAARARLERATWGTGAPGRRARRPAWSAPRHSWRLAAAAGLVAAVTAGVVTAQVTAPGGAHPAGGAHPVGGAHPAGALTVRELAYRASAAAARQPDIQPGQWVYWQEKTLGPGCGEPCGAFHVWTTADSQKAAWVYQGKVVSLPGGPFVGQPAPRPSPKGGFTVSSGTMQKIPVSYADLGSLPSDPGALDRYLGQLSFPGSEGWGPPAIREFMIIETLLTSYVMPPQLTAELYQALGDIPGVAVDDHAVDVAGRQGVGFTSADLPDGQAEELILDPRTYELIGNSLLHGPSHQLVDGTAILQRALVAGPGEQP